jgi:UDP-N-acetyl-D-galactosamine dehydrogenase
MKVVSGQDQRTLDIIAEVYGSVVRAGIFKAASIKVAEAAKVIENTQRDLNISLMNEISLIFRRMGIDTQHVLAAANTKWNFLPFSPGLVGGHCIGVDPYYLTHKAEMLGYHSEVILAGRRINDSMGEIIAKECVRLLSCRGVASGMVAVLGLTFKENVPDIRNSKVSDIISCLKDFGLRVAVHDPYAAKADALREYKIHLAELDDIPPADAVILAVPHLPYLEGGWALVQRCLRDQKGVVMDVRSCLPYAHKPDEVSLWRL